MEFVIKNYRCFTDKDPARIRIAGGFVSFVGVNNSGKSALLRFFYDFRNLFVRLTDRNNLHRILSGRDGLSGLSGDVSNLFSNQSGSDLFIEMYFSAPQARIGDGAYDLMLEIALDRKQLRTERCMGRLLDLSHGGSVISRNATLSEDFTLSAPGFEALLVDFRDYMTSLSNSFYVGPFRNAILVQSEHRYYEMAIGKDFVNLWSQVKTGENAAQAKRIHDLEHYIKRIFGFDEFIIDANHEKTALQITINREIYRLEEVGSGLAQFIVVLTNVVLRGPDFVLIDEPESNLHPSLQIDFLTALGTFAKRGVLFATHNIGLARSVSDQIYSLVKHQDGMTEVRELEETPRLAEFLGELSFSGYQELGFDGILLVEGRTDIKTFLVLLRLYGLEHEMVILFLGGSDLINGKSEEELLELTRISRSIFAIIDSERTSANADISKERKDFGKVCQRLKIDCLILDRTAIENYFTEAAVQHVKGGGFHALPTYGKLQDVDPHWAKDENWKIANRSTLDELKDTDLGRFLRSVKEKLVT